MYFHLNLKIVVLPTFTGMTQRYYIFNEMRLLIYIKLIEKIA